MKGTKEVALTNQEFQGSTYKSGNQNLSITRSRRTITPQKENERKNERKK